jgi:hypothetical protein
MQIAQTFASKAVVAAVATAMIFSAFTAPAKAQSVEDLQKMINDLMAQISALQGGSTTAAAGVCPYTWTRDLKTGATGADVMTLQKFLNANADTRVAATGAGSAGMETSTFGPMTAAAVSKFQVMYRADILTPAGLTNPTGYFGPSTRAKANALCVATTPTTPTGTSTTPSTPATTLQGEADLNDFIVDDADDTTLEEGASDAAIGTFTINFKNGDAKVDRLDLSLAQVSGSGSDQPWDIFDKVSLWVDGKQVASMDASSRNDYLDETDGSLRFSGLNLVAKEDEDLVVTVAADLIKNNDGANDWSVSADSMRYFDAAGVATNENTFGDLGGDNKASVTIDEAGTNDQIQVKLDSSNPTDKTLEVKDDAKSDWYTTLVFNLDTKDSVNDVTLNDLYVDVVTAGNAVVSATSTIDDAQLVIDGKTVDVSSSDITAVSGTTTVRVHFDLKGDTVINAGDVAKAEFKLKFKSLAVSSEGATVVSSISGDSTHVDAEGADNITDLTGTANGKTMTLRTKGIVGETKSNSASLTTASVSGTHDYVTYTIAFDVTAFNQDLYIPKAATSTASVLLDGNGNVTAATSSVDSFTSTADDTNVTGWYYVPEGSTETFTLVVKWTPAGAAASKALQLQTVYYKEATSDASFSSWTAAPAKDFKTEAKSTAN